MSEGRGESVWGRWGEKGLKEERRGEGGKIMVSVFFAGHPAAVYGEGEGC